jgi:hypothetical protein
MIDANIADSQPAPNHRIPPSRQGPSAPLRAEAAVLIEDIEALDRIAPEALTRGLPGRVVGEVDRLLEADLSGHPWTQLLAAAACHDTYRGDPRATALLDGAWAEFEARGDRTGLGVAANVRANLFLSCGDLAGAVSWWQRAEALLGQSNALAISMAAHRSLDAYSKGDLGSAEHCAREALLLADATGNPGDVAVPLVYLALYAFCLGDFERSSRILEVAERVTSRSTVIAVRNEGALVAAFSGAVSAVRDHQAEADAWFAIGLSRADVDGAPWYATMVRTLRAEFTAGWAPKRSLLDARLARREAIATGDAWWSGLALMAEGTALAQLGELVEARRVLADSTSELQNPIERAFAQMHLGEVLVRLGDRSAARAVLESARLACEGAGARYWATRSTLAMSAADRDRGGRWLRLARSTAGDDAAYDHLFTPAHHLRISVIGRPSVTIEGRRVEFLTRHAELAVYLLAIAGPVGVPNRELEATFWPGVDERRTGPRLRTLLWQARNALGGEAWRLQRRRGRVFLELNGVEVDLHEADLAGQERAATARMAESDFDSEDTFRAAAPNGGRGGDGFAVAAHCLLEGWDVDLPLSFDDAPVADLLRRFG